MHYWVALCLRPAEKIFTPATCRRECRLFRLRARWQKPKLLEFGFALTNADLAWQRPLHRMRSAGITATDDNAEISARLCERVRIGRRVEVPQTGCFRGFRASSRSCLQRPSGANRDGESDLTNVRFGPLCGVKSDISRSPRSATSGLMHRSRSTVIRSLGRRGQAARQNVYAGRISCGCIPARNRCRSISRS